MKKIRIAMAVLTGVAAALAVFVPQLGFKMPHPDGLDIHNALLVVGNSVIFALFCLAFCFSVIRGRLKPAAFGKHTLRLLLAMTGTAGVGELLFSFRVVRTSSSGVAVIAACIAVETAICLFIYLSGRARAARENAANSVRKSAVSSGTARHCYNTLYCAMMMLVLVCAAGLFFHGDNFPLAAMLAVALVGLISWRVTGLRLFLLAAYAGLLLQGFTVFGNCALSFSGTFVPGRAAMVLSSAVPCIFLIFSIADLYVRKDKAI